MTTKQSNFEAIIKQLFENNATITLKQIAAKAGLSSNNSSDRRAIQRALSALIDQNIISAQGAARARVYLPRTTFAAQTISLYKTEPIKAQEFIDYNPGFLNSYIPNKTYYLDDPLREELMLLGRVEPVIRPAGTYARSILNRLLIDLSWNSSRLEGNTYSILETQRLIEFGETAQGKDAFEAHMILNHKNAIEYIIELAQEKNISAHEMRSVHALLAHNLLDNPSSCGRMRHIAVNISGSLYRPSDNPYLLQECFNQFIDKFNQINDPFEQSFFALAHISYLQAFEDINKRTSRLVANIPLIKMNLKPFSFIKVKQEDYVQALLAIYEKNDIGLLRDWYLRAYQQSARYYSAVQQEPDILKLRYHVLITKIINELVLKKTPGNRLHSEIKKSIAAQRLPITDSEQLLDAIEIEIISLHEDNIARFKIKPSEFLLWKSLSN
ncbi:MAG: Fic family protein [Gammaproteobacteria bacterium]|nr:Fic family protein [Gammaproteobacteria bacterium]